MKYSIVVAVVVCTFGFSECVSDELRMKLFQKLITQCGIKEHVSDEDVNAMKALVPNNTYGSKCIQACIGESSGIIKDRHVHPAIAAKMIKAIYNGDEDIVQKARETAEACVDVTDDDRCLAAFKISECTLGYAKSNGFIIDFL